ncbi:MAG: excinuclease ABC subunit UvrA, partial [Deltaproteobacteria bacterium]|nr:excinuclease ABC subunit UvrA [Deltaproteobacteria bacterium]
DLGRFMNIRPCPVCEGTRLKKPSLFIKVADQNIAEITKMSIGEVLPRFKNLQLSPKDRQIAERILKEILDRLQFLHDVGLNYLTLDRKSGTLSGGEDQRIRLATQIGSALTGVLYVLDEPSIGLHQRDNDRLLATLKKLRDLGNTVLVVEHDKDTILNADHVIDLGPGAGVHGGHLVAAGTPQEISKNGKSLTGLYLSGKKQIPLPKQRLAPNNEWLVLKAACEHNLKKIDVKFPLHLFTCITGVSGSGKSTLVNETLYRGLMQRLFHSKEPAGKVEEIEGVKFIDKVISIDQSPIGRTPRSNPATYTGVFTFIRDLFTGLPESKARGYKAGRFSFNVRGGRCEACEGDGVIKIEMHFLPDVYVECEVCRGRRFNRETLEIMYKGANIADVLKMTVEKAFDFFKNIPAVKNKLQTLLDVGMGYIELGQSATTLSGGEAQRIKLSRELSKRATGRTLYILDEPTTGLHFDDVQKLLDVLRRLVDQGNTVVVIEHNLDVIKYADYCIDLGPEGGEKGGYLVAAGTPESLTKHPTSYTGRYLREVLK